MKNGPSKGRFLWQIQAKKASVAEKIHQIVEDPQRTTLRAGWQVGWRE